MEYLPSWQCGLRSYSRLVETTTRYVTPPPNSMCYAQYSPIYLVLAPPQQRVYMGARGGIQHGAGAALLRTLYSGHCTHTERARAAPACWAEGGRRQACAAARCSRPTELVSPPRPARRPPPALHTSTAARPRTRPAPPHAALPPSARPSPLPPSTAE